MPHKPLKALRLQRVLPNLEVKNNCGTVANYPIRVKTTSDLTLLGTIDSTIFDVKVGC